MIIGFFCFFFFSSRRRHTRFDCDWSSDVCSSDLDAPGFVSNRVLMPMINEAIFCVMEGVATPEAVDTVMKLGMNHPLGPLALADLIGLDRSEEHTSELQSQSNLVCRLLLEKKKHD